MQTFVVNGDLRGLRAYLMVVAATSASNEDGWRTTLDSLVEARKRLPKCKIAYSYQADHVTWSA